MAAIKIMEFHFSKGIDARLVTAASVTHSDSSGKFFGHRHSYCELHFVERGDCQLAVCGRSYRLQSGDYCLLPPYTFHNILEASRECVHRCVSFELLENGEEQNDTEREILRRSQSGRALFGSSEVVAAELQYLFRMLADSRDDYIAREKIRALLALTVLDIFDGAVPRRGCQETEAVSLGQSRKYLIDEFLNTHFDQHGGAVFLAKQLGISGRQLNRIFQTLYGKSYREKIQEIRLETAISLLENTDRSIEEIAVFVGYENISSFFYFIKQHTGLTPKTIRQQLRPE